MKTRYPSKTVDGVSSTTDYEQPSYDANGNVTALRLRDGQLIAFSYDALDRLTAKNVPGTADDVSYAYDLLGRLTDARYPATNWGVANAYDALGRLTVTGTNMGGIDRPITYLHDVAGRRTRITHPDGAWFGMSYDALGLMTNAEWVKGSIGPVPFLGIAYDDLGRRASTGRASSTGYGYDAISRLSALTQNFGGGVGNASTNFGYNPAHQIATQTRDNDAYALTGFYTGPGGRYWLWDGKPGSSKDPL